MADRVIIDPTKQFSKRLARWTSIFWFFYMTWLSVILLLQPASAMFSVYMGIIVTAVMIVNVWAYTRNSVYEKGVFAMLDKTRIELGFKNAKTDAEEAESNVEEVSNG